MNRKFGKFTVLDKIAQGAMGDIFLVEDEQKKQFALKTLRTCIDSSEDSESRIRFNREITLSEKIDHPYIVRNYFHDLKSDQPYMVMEYLSKGTLDFRITEEKVLSPNEVIKVAINITKALAECQAHEIIHRDVKPANILISEDGSYKLSDLGLARFGGVGSENLTMSQTALGTPYYISPEQAVDAKKADIRSDIYSLGATLYYALTGKRVHEGNSSVQVLMKHLNDDIIHPSLIRKGLPRNLCAVIMKMLDKDIKKRYQTPASVIKDLEKIEKFDASPEDLTASGMVLNKPGSKNKTGMLMFSFLFGLIFVACFAVFKFSCLPPSQTDKSYLKARAELKDLKFEESLEFIVLKIKKIENFLSRYPNTVDASEIQKAVFVAQSLIKKNKFHVILKKVGNLKEARAFSFRLFVDGEKFEFTSEEKKKVLFPEARIAFNWMPGSEIKMQFEEFEWLDDLIFNARIPDYFSIRALTGDRVYKVKPPYNEYFQNGEFHIHYELEEISESDWKSFDDFFYPGHSW